MTKEEAIKVAYGIPVTKAQHEALQFLVPELAESEDERIRKELIKEFKAKLLKRFEWKEGIPNRRVLDWLEKQKEQKPKNILTDNDSLQTAYLKGQTDVLEDPEAYGLQKEQKPIHTAKEAWKEMRLEVYAQASGNRHEPNYSDESTKMFSLCDIDEIFEKIGNSPVGSQPAEWSGEDETIIEDACNALEIHGHTKLASRLKSLRPQPKQEWSEEDEAHRKFISESLEDHIKFCKKDAEGAYYAKQIRTAQNWLNDLPLRFKNQ